jgi:hypothetical protein
MNYFNGAGSGQLPAPGDPPATPTEMNYYQGA